MKKNCPKINLGESTLVSKVSLAARVYTYEKCELFNPSSLMDATHSACGMPATFASAADSVDEQIFVARSDLELLMRSEARIRSEQEESSLGCINGHDEQPDMDQMHNQGIDRDRRNGDDLRL